MHTKGDESEAYADLVKERRDFEMKRLIKAS
jgi:hypothetical protein